MTHLAATSAIPRVTVHVAAPLRQRVRKALMRGWLRLCRCALRKDRFVPYC